MYGEVEIGSLGQLVRGFFDQVVAKILQKEPKSECDSITDFKLAALKFDLDNIHDRRSFPAIAVFEFQICGLRAHYRAKEFEFDFENRDQSMIERLAAKTVVDLEEMFQECVRPYHTPVCKSPLDMTPKEMNAHLGQLYLFEKPQFKTVTDAAAA